MATINKPRKIKELESFVSKTMGDGKGPNLFVVTDQGSTVTITRSFTVAYAHWSELAARSPMVECALEDRAHGCLASIEPIDDSSGARLIRTDDTYMVSNHCNR